MNRSKVTRAFVAGLTQSAFDGHPLYYFAHDVAPGDLLGRGGLQGAFDVFDPSSL